MPDLRISGHDPRRRETYGEAQRSRIKLRNLREAVQEAKVPQGSSKHA